MLGYIEGNNGGFRAMSCVWSFLGYISEAFLDAHGIMKKVECTTVIFGKYQVHSQSPSEFFTSTILTLHVP